MVSCTEHLAPSGPTTDPVVSATELPGRQGTGETRQVFPSVADFNTRQPPFQAAQASQQEDLAPVRPMSPSSDKVSKMKTSANSLNKTSDSMGQWFAEMVCHIWFAPGSSRITGASMPVSPSRLSEDLSVASRQSIGHHKTRSQDFSFSTLSAQPDRPLGPPIFAEEQPRVHSDDHRLFPQRRFVTFIRDTVRVSSVSASVLILALLYIRRLKLKHPNIQGQDGSEFRVAIAALMLGNKFLDDHTYTNKSWSDISGIALKDVNKLEVEFWLGLQMTIHVTMRDFTAWQQSLQKLTAQRQQMLSQRAADLTRRKMLALEQNSPRTLRFRNSISNGHAACAPASTSAPVDGGSFAWQLTRALHSTMPAAAASTPGSNDARDINSTSPTSQRSISTAATSIAGVLPDVHRSSPEATFYNSRHASPFDVSGHVHKHMTAVRNPPCVLPNRPATDLVGHGSVGEPGRKRRREDSCDEVDNARIAKKPTGHAQPQDSGNKPVVPSVLLPPSNKGYLPHSSNAQTVGYPPSWHSTIAPHMGAVSSNAAMHHTGNSISAQSDNLCRSIFAQPLTPEGLIQPYAGPAPPSNIQRQLSFYQLASGQSHGLPAYHLAAPVQHNPWHGGSNHARRHLVQSLSPQSVATCSSGYPYPGPAARSARVSPEGFGTDSRNSHMNTQGRQIDVFPSAASCSASPLDAYWGSSRPQQTQDTTVQGQQRWVPFCNVPIAVQLQHLQQWQRLGANAFQNGASLAGYQHAPMPSNMSDGYRGSGAWPSYFSPHGQL